VNLDISRHNHGSGPGVENLGEDPGILALAVAPSLLAGAPLIISLVC
jgi:hypothetical protein